MTENCRVWHTRYVLCNMYYIAFKAGGSGISTSFSSLDFQSTQRQCHASHSGSLLQYQWNSGPWNMTLYHVKPRNYPFDWAIWLGKPLSFGRHFCFIKEHEMTKTSLNGCQKMCAPTSPSWDFPKSKRKWKDYSWVRNPFKTEERMHPTWIEDWVQRSRKGKRRDWCWWKLISCHSMLISTYPSLVLMWAFL